MSEPSTIADDPFAPSPPDEVAELDALRNAIELASRFTLLFACCNQAGHRDRLMAELQAQLTGRRVQLLALREPVRNLLEVLRVKLDSPPPDVLFLHGIEDWLPFGDEAEAAPFVLNLNAARNHFPREVPCPVVFWIPQHILTTLARAAPDFCSVRSGLYFFCATPEVRDRIAESLTSHGVTAMAGLPYDEKLERADALAAMLAEYEALPSDLRDSLAEARLLDSLATLQQVLGDFKAAEPLFQQALEVRESVLGPDHPDTAASLNNLAGIYDCQGRYSEAELHYRRALEFCESALDPDHPNTAISLNNLAGVYASQGRHSEAEPLYRRALKIRESALGPDHNDTALSLSNLAYLCISQGQYSEAEPLFRRALKIREATLGPDHPHTATSLNNLAGLYDSQGRYAEAEPLFRRALEINESMLGPDHPDTAASLNNLAGLYGSQSRYSEAEPLYRRALEICKAGLGSDHPDTAASLNNLAFFYCSQGRYSEAEPLYHRALEIIESASGPDHPNTAIFFGNYAVLLHQIGREDEAAKLTSRAQTARAAHARRNAKASDEVPSQ